MTDALACTAAGADFLGFIFYPLSPRYIDPARAREIIRSLPPTVIPVGVFVNEKRFNIEHAVSLSGVKIIQLSGDEKPEDCAGYSLDVWKAFRINTLDEFEQIQRYKLAAALLDGSAKGLYGGTGVVADINIALEIKKHHKLVLAGGLSPDNILRAVFDVRPYAVDVNSGVEIIPGKKNHEKVKRLFDELKNTSINF